MDKNKDVLDKIIEDAILDELDKINISDDEIEAEWLKLKNKTFKNISKSKTGKPNRAIAIAATTFCIRQIQPTYENSPIYEIIIINRTVTIF